MKERILTFLTMIAWLAILGAVYVVRRLGLVRLVYDSHAAVSLVICGRTLRRWEPEQFFGWGHPFAPLFWTDGDWMLRENV